MSNNKEKSKSNKKIIIIVSIVVAIILALVITIFTIVSGFIKNNLAGTNKDISKYEEYLKNGERGDSWLKYNMDESIWPSKITKDMQIEDYKMSFIDIIDAQFVGFLKVQYNKDDYKKEISRLKKYKSTEYKDLFGVTGVGDKCELIAMNADKDYGFVYALTDNKDTVMYVEMIFTDWFLDIHYKKIIPKECILEGLDVSEDNKYRKEKLKELEEKSKELESDLDL